MFKKLRLKYAEKVLKKEMQSYTRQAHFVNFSLAKHVGIVYCQAKDAVWELNDLLVILNRKQIKVSIMVYTPTPSIPSDFLITLNKFIFCKRELNWYYKPEPKEVQRFIETSFDILIDFTRSKQFPIHYIMSLSRAVMKIGRNNYAGNPYDFVMAVPEDKEDTFYFEQLKHYFKHISVKD